MPQTVVMCHHCRWVTRRKYWIENKWTCPKCDSIQYQWSMDIDWLREMEKRGMTGFKKER